jgi:hypothetical protein
MSTTHRVLWSLLLGLGTYPVRAEAQGNLCSLFSAGEITKLLGTAVEPGEPAAMGTGCQWFGKDEQSYSIIQVLDTTYWIDPRQAPGYEVIPALGTRAYSHPDVEGGFRASALTDKSTAMVVMIGHTANRAGAVTVLRQLLLRFHPEGP